MDILIFVAKALAVMLMVVGVGGIIFIAISKLVDVVRRKFKLLKIVDFINDK